MKPQISAFLKLILSIIVLSVFLDFPALQPSRSDQLAIAAPDTKEKKIKPQHKQKRRSQTKRVVKRSHAKKNAAKRRHAKKNNGGDMSWVALHKQFPNVFMTNGSRDRKIVALTFDDAPDPRFTPAILDVLAKYNICATFFIVGERAAKHPELVDRIIKEGHVIGNHSYNHSVFSTLSMYQYEQQIWKTDGIIKRITGLSPNFIRPPYGELLPKQAAWGKKYGYTIVNWDVDSEDWKKNPSSARVLANIRKTLQPGSIILQHAGGGEGQDLSGTINALPVLIEWLQGKGYDLLTLPEMLGKKPYR
ncbi:polysaccharide deacetylase family protein [Paenibacillus nanensis]|nr:polysaccharide deacetylase family protein [Paenibacillus nanensis]